MGNPKVTVLMPVYNAEKYVGEAIESILNQTFRDFEFLIINDGSTDNSLGIIESYKDLRIKLVNNEKNLGLSHTLNKGIELSEGEYIARMDADDVSLPGRLEKQVEFMDSHPHIGICGSWMQSFDQSGNKGIWQYPQTHDELLFLLFFNSCFAHPTVCLRKLILLESGLRYKQEFTPAEDYYLWSELVEVTRFFNLQEVLLRYRLSETQMSNNIFLREKTANTIRLKVLSNTGINLNDLNNEQLEFHLALLNKTWIANEFFFKRAINWLETISRNNQNQVKIPKPLFAKKLSEFLFGKSLMHASVYLNTLSLYKESKLSPFYKPRFYNLLKIKIKELIKFW